MQNRNVFLLWINLVTLKNLCRNNVSNFYWTLWLNTISQQNGNSIDDGIAPPAALAAYDRSLKFRTDGRRGKQSGADPLLVAIVRSCVS